jgi:CheY-like chemotaxis protein
MTQTLHDNQSSATGVGGRRVLVVEDESMVSMLLEDFLADLGYVVVAVASRLNEALEKASSLTFDVAILDVNLNGKQTFPVAEALRASGRAIVFATGYGETTVPLEFRSVPILQKPFQQHDLERALRMAVGASPS